jgi:HSP20 family protein
MARDLATLHDRMNRFLDEVFPGFQRQQQSEDQEFQAGNWTPPVDIYEDENAIHVKADLPGIDPDTLDVRVEGNRLLLRGERNFENETKKENFYRIERSYGSFIRAFTLPQNIQADRIDAQYRNGELKITLPKREEAKPKQIRVNVQGISNQQEQSREQMRPSQGQTTDSRNR